MKIVMTILARDEQDVIRENIEFHKSQGVDFFIAMDNQSVDGTTSVLKEYEKQGILKYIGQSEAYSQSEWVTEMARMAFLEFNADWIINNDADEFWWANSGSLKKELSNIPAEFTAVRAKRHNFIAIAGCLVPCFGQMIYREVKSLNPFGNPLPSKLAHRGRADVIVKAGSHKLECKEQIKVFESELEILHFPVRSYLQLVRKIVHKGVAYRKNQELKKFTEITERPLFDLYERNGGDLSDYYQGLIYGEDRIRAELSSGRIIKDERLYAYLKKLEAL